jgi:hypothetical protein
VGARKKRRQQVSFSIGTPNCEGVVPLDPAIEERYCTNLPEGPRLDTRFPGNNTKRKEHSAAVFSWMQYNIPHGQTTREHPGS